MTARAQYPQQQLWPHQQPQPSPLSSDTMHQALPTQLVHQQQQQWHQQRQQEELEQSQSYQILGNTVDAVSPSFPVQIDPTSGAEATAPAAPPPAGFGQSTPNLDGTGRASEAPPPAADGSWNVSEDVVRQPQPPSQGWEDAASSSMHSAEQYVSSAHTSQFSGLQWQPQHPERSELHPGPSRYEEPSQLRPPIALLGPSSESSQPGSESRPPDPRSRLSVVEANHMALVRQVQELEKGLIKPQ
eukprot:gnl/TRDRNA2_/TRDRNA2_153078_c3_seq1.p1 gnl/TRDRNA2_/TRDRNA2_153078_c3~~gnl/TRDRNA2_/TRDRNA2_153078_c3_seq1.p1  ORF type:complete len:244 (+),score=33.59 gnl/TRDRNA2_/TRDRNA2_153078_c3_seq1:179-910(+)